MNKQTRRITLVKNLSHALNKKHVSTKQNINRAPTKEELAAWRIYAEICTSIAENLNWSSKERNMYMKIAQKNYKMQCTLKGIKAL